MRKLGIVFYLSILFSQHSIEKDLAYQMVLSHLEDKNLPEAYIKEAFTHDKIKIHPEIADRFARPYEKKLGRNIGKYLLRNLELLQVLSFLQIIKTLLSRYQENIKLIQL